MKTKNLNFSLLRISRLSILLIVILTQLYIGNTIAQPVTFDWAKRMGNVNDDKGNKITSDSNGNIFIVGTFTDTVDFDPGPGVSNLIPIGYTDIFVSKFDGSGNLIWAKQFGGSVHDGATGIAVDATGNVYATGNFANTSDFDPGAGIFNLTSAGGLDVFILKLDASGNFVWARQLGGSQVSSLGDDGKSIAVDKAGNVYTAGRFEFLADFDPGPGVFNLTAAGNFSDVFVSKLNAQGNFVWAKKWGSAANSDWINTISVDDSANVYATGSFYGNVDFDPGTGTFNMTPGGLSGVYVSKLDSTGSFKWAKQFSKQGGFLLDAGDLTLDNQGFIYTTGSFSGTVDFNPGTATNNITAGSGLNSFICKLNSSGIYVWAKGFGGTGEVSSLAITTDIFGSVYTTGWFNDNNPNCDFDPGPASLIIVSAGYLDVFISKLDASGNFSWAKGFGGTLEDYGQSVVTDANANVYTTGYFSGTADFDPGAATFNLTAAASKDIFMHKLGQTGAGLNEVNNASVISVYPNPSTGKFKMVMNGLLNIGRVEIYTLSGNKIFTDNFNTISKKEINLDHLPSGMYFMQVNIDGKKVINKLTILRP